MKLWNTYFSRQAPRYRWIVIGCFVIYAVIGIFAYNDYGISFDEPLQRQQGIISANYVMEKISPQNALPGVIPLQSFANRNYGVLFDMPAYFLEVWLNLDANSPSVYYLRHVMTFALFFIAVTYLYRLIAAHFKDWRLGLLGSAFLVLSPRIFAESFYNNKDVVFLSVFIIGLYYGLKFLEKKNYISAVQFALACAAAIGVRMPGIILPIAGLVFYCLELGKETEKFKKRFLSLLLFIGAVIIFTITLWPTLWEYSWQNFRGAYMAMAHFPWNGQVLYFGKFVNAQQLPWHYVPVWIGITTPLLYIVLFITGVIGAITVLIKKLRERVYDKQARFCLYTLFFFFAPLGLVILSGAVLYDGWRHMYFLYAPFIILAVSGFAYVQKVIIKKLPGRWGALLPIGIVTLCLLVTAGQMIHRHPFENAYFNILAGNPENRFDVDYWGLSYRQGWEYLLKTVPDPVLNIHVNNPPGIMNLMFFAKDYNRKIVFTPPEQADYILTEHRYQKQLCAYKNPVKILYAGDVKVMGIYRGHQACEPVASK